MPPIAELPVTFSLKDFWRHVQSASYRLTPQVTSWTETSTIPAGLPGLVFAKLGDAAWQRFRDFSRWPDGWAGPGSHAIAWGTYLNLERFLDASRFPTSRTPPSLFVSDEGFLGLQWEARDGTTVSVTLHPSGADYFIESEGSEGSVEDEGIAALAERLNRTWA
jgi:hypothetical protein